MTQSFYKLPEIFLNTVKVKKRSTHAAACLQKSSPVLSLLLPTSPQMCTAPHCGREILFPINIEAGMPLPQWARIFDSFNHHSPRCG